MADHGLVRADWKARTIAREQGLPRYMGLPCKYGHVPGERMANNGECVCCRRLRDRRRRALHPDPPRPERNKAYYIANKPKFVLRAKARKPRVKLATPKWANRRKVEAFYVVSRFMNKMGVPVHVDHVIPLRGKNVCGLHVETNFTVSPPQRQ